jgi:hypothetical protein
VVQPGVKCVVKIVESNHLACELGLNINGRGCFAPTNLVSTISVEVDFQKFGTISPGIGEVLKLLKRRTLFVRTFEIIC